MKYVGVDWADRKAQCAAPRRRPYRANAYEHFVLDLDDRRLPVSIA